MRKTAAILLTALQLALPGATLAAAPTVPVPQVTAPAAVLMDAASGQVLFAKAAHRPRPPASMTKLMTLLLAVEAIRRGKAGWEQPVSVSEEAWRLGGSQIWLEPGEQLSLRQMLLAVAVGSANDAAVAVGEALAGSEAAFVRQMNLQARQLGMRHTSFRNAHGLQQVGHVTTAYDLALLARRAVRHRSLLDLTRRWEDRTIRNGKGGTLWLVNPNRLLKLYPGTDGLKTGYTSQAGYCVAATAKRGNMRLIAVVMGEPNSQARWADVIRLFNYGFANYRTLGVARRGVSVGTVEVTRGERRRVAAALARELWITVPRGSEAALRRQVRLPGRVAAPVRRGQRLGELRVTAGGQVVGEVPLVAAQQVRAVSFWGLWRRAILNMLGLQAGNG
jgi:D-alanyl-D-alanine carboxypeptidase (penicillin-binding protein 5/6)